MFLGHSFSISDSCTYMAVQWWPSDSLGTLTGVLRDFHLFAAQGNAFLSPLEPEENQA